jgi:hypothetical protein
VDNDLCDSAFAQILTRFAAPRKLLQTMTVAAANESFVAAQADALAPSAAAVLCA